MPLPSSLHVNEQSFFLESRHVEPPFVHGCHFWSILHVSKKFGFCAAKLLETPRYLTDLARFYTGGNGLIELLPTKGVVNVGMVLPI